MKKIFVIILIAALLSGTSTPLVFGQQKLDTHQQLQPIAEYPDEIDQKQETYIEGILLPVGTLPLVNTTVNAQVAQSFIPEKEVLTRVELFIGKNTTTTYPYSVGIRDDLSGENLAEASVNAADITTQNFSWIQFDIPDLFVTLDQTYYIICYTQNITDNWYLWAANNDSTSYQKGCAWVSLDGNNWSNQSTAFNQHNENLYTPIKNETETWDMCFRTYGLEATSLQISLSGIIFPTLTIQNIGTVTAYEVEWSVDVHGSIPPIKHYEGILAELAPNESILIRLPLFGLGKITINATAKAANAPPVYLDIEGFLLLIIFIQS